MTRARLFESVAAAIGDSRAPLTIAAYFSFRISRCDPAISVTRLDKLPLNITLRSDADGGEKSRK